MWQNSEKNEGRMNTKFKIGKGMELEKFPMRLE